MTKRCTVKATQKHQYWAKEKLRSISKRTEAVDSNKKKKKKCIVTDEKKAASEDLFK